MAVKQSMRRLILPAAEFIKQYLARIIYPPQLEYAPEGWETVLAGDETDGWNSLSVVKAEKEKWDVFCNLIRGAGPLGFSHEQNDLASNRILSFHNLNITYGYVLALAAHSKYEVSVLDYGGGLGHYYQLGKALLPGIGLKFYCKEVPGIAETGKQLNPDIQWFTDDSCLKQTFDLVMISSSLQYLEHWQEFLRAVPPSVGEYLFLSRIPVVEKSDSFVSVQKAYDTKMLHWQFNRKLLLQTVESAGFSLLREFVTGDRPYIKNAPEQCELCSWLFRKIR
jgi:putative methyltransferase (TIGR04325 family)